MDSYGIFFLMCRMHFQRFTCHILEGCEGWWHIFSTVLLSSGGASGPQSGLLTVDGGGGGSEGAAVAQLAGGKEDC